ncbi:Nucleotidylyl transferase [Ceraceosorus guamensis]|uniref:Nucleotidylyl transferase n=1 Tax=Ceraceosorus guamensis TaxID=1522189 RepID=A0A316VP31_9BASI|nr:Nucleotidylyl transferase [Ceraceosorus guamensis]PWN38828.1 Nucleotidylyl transferase [Ceraceosorus guamensis]
MSGNPSRTASPSPQTSSSGALGPLPRMTDSTAGPGPGAASAKLAALSIESYHLDSPPFTGAAVGGGGQSMQAQASTDTAVGSAGPPRSRKTSQNAHNAHSKGVNQDVPGWQLDDDARTPGAELAQSYWHDAGGLSAKSTAPASNAGRQSPHSTDTTIGSVKSLTRAGLAEVMSAPVTLSNQERQGRPAYTQTEDVDGFGEESSSHPADAYDELDAAQHELGAGSRGHVPRQAQGKEHYAFPRHRLPTRMRDDSKVPLVIVACGSFSPPTYLHLRIFEMAKDQVIEEGKYELLGGYFSPVSDYYKKEGLAKATHRVRMCELAVERTSTWLMVDAWESLQDEYQRTAVVLDHFDDEINGGQDGGVLLADGTRRRIRIMLLAGGDLIQSMGEPGVWAEPDLHHILGRYGCMIVERTGADVWTFLLSHDLLWKYRRNLNVVTQVIYDDVSSSKIRLFLRRGKSIRYLLPQAVVSYMAEHQLYRLPAEAATEPVDADKTLNQ